MTPKDGQELFVRYLTNCRPSLYAYLLSLLPNRDDASDVFQDTNLVIHSRLRYRKCFARVQSMHQ